MHKSATRWYQQLLPGVLTLWLVYLFMRPYLSINGISRPFLLGVLAVLAVVISGWRSWRGRGWPLAAGLLTLSTYFVVWGLVPLGYSPTPDWLGHFVARFWLNARQFLRSGGVGMPTNVSVLLVVALILFLAVAVMGFRHYQLSVLLVFAYLVAVHVFNGDNLMWSFLQLAVITGLFALLRQTGLRLSPRFWLTGAGLLLVIGIVYGVDQTVGTKWLAEPTTAVRTKLNDRGFYEALTNYAKQATRTGYTENDTTLGGPVYDDNTPVMTVTARTAQYVRVEVKTRYTGKGWEIAGRDTNLRRTTRNGTTNATISDEDATAAYAKTGQPVTVTNKSPESYIGLPYGKLHLTSLVPGQLAASGYSTTLERLYSFAGEFKRVTMTQYAKTATPAKLRALGNIGNGGLAADLQVPSSLPKRVRQLASRLTKNKTTTYDRVKAIQNYLLMDPHLQYSKVDTPTTPKNRDYVDYFLFTSHVGYCDNFSSAMVIMLRTIGIPARWAKGFNSGTQTDSTSGGRGIYTITNANAHSWPEVYFGEYGWLPFEPTPGFVNDAEPQTAANTTSATASSRTTQTSSTSSSSQSTKTTSSSQTTSSARTRQSQSTRQGNLVPWGWILLAVVLVAGLWALPHVPAWLFTVLSFGLTDRNFARRYRLSLALLGRVAKRGRGESLGHYAAQIDQRLGTRGWTQVTTRYEAAVFGGQQPVPPTDEWRAVAKAFHGSRYAHWWQRAVD